MARAPKEKPLPTSEWSTEAHEEEAKPQEENERPQFKSEMTSEPPSNEGRSQGQGSFDRGRREFSDSRRDQFRGYNGPRGDYSRGHRDEDLDRPRGYERPREFDRPRGYDRPKDFDRPRDLDRPRDFDRFREGDYGRGREDDRYGYRDQDRRRPYGGYRDGDQYERGRDGYRDGRFRDEYREKRHRQLREDPTEPNETIGIFNLSYNLTPRDFDEYLNGKLADFKGKFTAKLVLSKFTDKCRGYGFVQFEDIKDAIKAKGILENGEIFDQQYRVAYSVQRKSYGEPRFGESGKSAGGSETAGVQEN